MNEDQQFALKVLRLTKQLVDQYWIVSTPLRSGPALGEHRKAQERYERAIDWVENAR